MVSLRIQWNYSTLNLLFYGFHSIVGGTELSCLTRFSSIVVHFIMKRTRMLTDLWRIIMIRTWLDLFYFLTPINNVPPIKKDTIYNWPKTISVPQELHLINTLYHLMSCGNLNRVPQSDPPCLLSSLIISSSVHSFSSLCYHWITLIYIMQ